MLSICCRKAPKRLGGHDIEREGDVDKAHDDPGVAAWRMGSSIN